MHVSQVKQGSVSVECGEKKLKLDTAFAFTVVEVIYQKRVGVFHQGFQTPRI